jgi:Flp pilus assembly protein TadG
MMKRKNCDSVLFARSTSRLSKGVALVLARLRSGSEGNALVEIAVTMPVVFMLLTGIFSLTIALSQKVQLAEAISNGGRVLAVERGDTDPCTVVTQAIKNTALGLDSSKMTLTYTLDGHAYGAGTTSCPGSGGGPNSYMVEGQTATVSATYPCFLTVYGAPLMSCSLGSQISEVIQ